ncbi:MAG TPA: carboxypeptidase-like regulatory domain-containing protein, partial [Thermoplasmata archaeon]|nr:carboxypeptidase-like regulatory domain-containing protein [Thermoplasmata archaeon]
GSTLLSRFNVTVPDAYGLSFNAPTMSQPLVIKPSTVQGFLTWSAANATSGPSPPVVGATFVLWGHNLTRLSATSDASGTFTLPNVPPGVYNASVVLHGSNFTESTVSAMPGKTVNETLSLSSGEIRGHVADLSGKPAASVVVSVSNSAGYLVTATTNSHGNYSIRDLGPGNYTVAASTVTPRQGSVPQSANLASAGANQTLNFTIVPVLPEAVQVLKNGAGAAGIPVRFTEILPPTPSIGPSNNTTRAHLTQPKANSTVALTDAEGIASVMLPAGNYSVYALGFSGSGYYAGFWSGPVGPGYPSIPALAIAPASELSGYANGTTNASISSPIEVSAYDRSGDVVWAFTNSTDRYSLWLPNGPYTILVSSPTPIQSALSTVNVAGATRLDLATTPTGLSTVVVLDNATGRPLSGASVSFSLSPHNGTVTAVTDSLGNASAILPTSPSTTTGKLPEYCVNVTAPGYLESDRCHLVGAQVNGQAPVRLVGAPIRSTIVVVGLPSSTSVEINLTGTSLGAVTQQVAGTSPISLSVSPGTYSVTAWAVGSPSGFYYPVSSTTWTIAPGEALPSLTIRMTDQVEVHGSLSVPSGSSASNARVQFVSSLMNRTVTDAQLLNGFYLAPGSYEYIATVPGLQAGQGWSDFGTVTVGGTGTLSTTFHLTVASVSFEGSVVLPSSAPLGIATTARFVNPSGFVFPASVSGGSYNVTLPANVTYTPYLNVTTSFLLNNATVVEALSVPRGDSCTVRPIGTICDLNLIGSPVNVAIVGRLSVANSPALVPGSVLIESLGSGVNPLRLSTAANGSFSASLPAGTYTVYANSSGGTYAALVTKTFGNAGGGTLDLVLAPAWTVSLKFVPPAPATVGPVALSVSSPNGNDLLLSGLPTGSFLALPLPAGTYEATATAPSTPYGVPTNATASVTFNLFTGNIALTLALAEQFVRTVAITVTTPTNLTQGIVLPPSGGTVSLGFSVRNAGNVPINVTVLGNPTAWNFTITPSNFTLGTGSTNNSASGAFSVRVPAGAPVAHAPVLLVAHLRGTTQRIGQSALPVPIQILPKSGVSVGRATSVDLSVTPSHVTVPLYALNTGNFPEGVALSVVDGASLAQFGWTATVKSAGAAVSGPISLAVSGNTSITVDLNATTGHAQPPGSVTVLASVVNRTGGVSSSTVTVEIPVVAISVNGTSLGVTGPNLGSPPATPDWLVPLLAFLPAIAFVVVLVVHRWYSTRRWVR